MAGIGEVSSLMPTLPDPPGEDERVDPWDLNEILLDLTASAVAERDQWAFALEVRRAIVEAKERRGAPALDVARARFECYGPLLQLQQYEEARAELAECRRTFEALGSDDELSSCLGALAQVESALGNGDLAVDLAVAALRVDYAHPPFNTRTVAAHHYLLANETVHREADHTTGIAHLTAAALLLGATTSLGYRLYRDGLAHMLALDAQPPTSLDVLAREVERIGGVRFRALLEQLGIDGEQVLGLVVEEARNAAPEVRYAREIAQWELDVVLVKAAAGGNLHAEAIERRRLAELAGRNNGAAVVRGLTRILDGERDRASLEAEVDLRSRTIVVRALDAVEGRVQLECPPTIRRILDDVVTVAGQRTSTSADAVDPELVARLDAGLAQLAESEEWVPLVVQLRRLADGSAPSFAGLDDQPTAVLCIALDLLAVHAGRIEDPGGEQPKQAEPEGER